MDDLSAHCRRDPPIQQIGEALVSCVSQALAAQGAIFWVVGKRRWWSRQAILNLVACTGTSDSQEFAKEVEAARHGILRKADRAGQESLLIGVPVMRDDKVLGVIEVIQRTGARPTAQRGYVRFVTEAAGIVAGCTALSSRE